MNEIVKGVVWKNPDNNMNMTEAMNINDEPYSKMSEVIAHTISNVIGETHNDRQILKRFIINTITGQMHQLLDEYNNVVAEDILKSFKDTLNASWDSAGNPTSNQVEFSTKIPDYDNARHAKLWSLANELREKIVMIKKSK